MAARLGRPLGFLGSVPFLVGTTRAHELGTARIDPPVALPVVLVLGTLPIIAIAVMPAIGHRFSTGQPLPAVVTLPGPLLDIGRLILRAGSLAALATVVGFGLIGGPGNPVPTVIWVLGLHGLATVAILGGNPWPLVSPWRTMYDWLCRLEGGILQYRSYPSRLGSWPALVGFVGGVGIVGTLSGVPRSPRLTALAVTFYATTMLAGAVVFGPVWLDRADPLAAFYRLLGRVSPLVVRPVNGEPSLCVRAPWATDAELDDLAEVTLVGAVVVTVLIDALAPTRPFSEVVSVIAILPGAAAEPVVGLYLVATALAVATVVVVTRMTVLTDYDRTGGGDGSRGSSVPWRLPAVMIPVAGALELAHEGPAALAAAGRILGMGNPLLWFPGLTVWVVLLGIVVGGHIVGQLIARRVIDHGSGNGRAPTRSRLPVAVLLVASTILSMWAISVPLLA